MTSVEHHTSPQLPGDAGNAPQKRPRTLVLLPVLVFSALAALFAFALRSGDPAKLPSVLLGKPVPDMTLPAMEGLTENEMAVPGFSSADLARGDVTVVNFFASWCAPCVQEHPVLIELKRATGVRIIGVNYKDPAPGGRRFIGRYGNPYSAVGVDASGRAAIDWGVYGMPETFIVGGDGRIILKQVGPMTSQVLAERIIPAIKAGAKSSRVGPR